MKNQNNGRPANNFRYAGNVSNKYQYNRFQGNDYIRDGFQDGGDGFSSRRRKKKRTSKGAKWIIALIIIAFLCGIGYYAYLKLTTPPEAAEGAAEGEYNILLLGCDREAMLTDVIMIVNINNNDGKVSIMQIPRDTYVNSAGVKLNSGKANEIFARYYGKYLSDGEKSDEAYLHALETEKELLAKSLGVNIDFAAVMDLSGFRNIVDAIGGVEIDVPNDMYYYDPEQDLSIEISAGKQVLDGADAEGFVRFRHDYLQGDLGRVNAQKIFLAAFFKELKDAVSITNIPTLTKLAGEVSKSLVTTMKVDDIVYFTKSLLGFDMENVTMITMPGQLDYNGVYYVMNRAAAFDVMSEYFNTYTEELNEDKFDSIRLFGNDTLPSVYDFYYADKTELYGVGEIYGGDEIENGAINVPFSGN